MILKESAAPAQLAAGHTDPLRRINLRQQPQK
jgi:hypothetical protein